MNVRAPAPPPPPPSCPVDNPPFKKPRIHPQPIPTLPLVNNKNMQSRAPEFQLNYNNSRMPPPPTRGGAIFFKTRECPKFREGTCPFGMNCNFAHGRGDIRDPPPNWQQLAGFHVNDRIGKWDEDQKIITMHRLCKNFSTGKVCPYGDRCNYLHEHPAKFREDSSPITITPAGPDARSLQTDAINTANLNSDANRLNSKFVPWKTRMCHKWIETLGHCPFGDRCHFAHGPAELKKYGCHNELEQGNVSMDPPKPLPVIANDAPVNKAASGGSSCKNQVVSKFMSQWKGSEKISSIYADWIDDTPNTHEN